MLAHETLKQADPHPDPQKNQGAYNGLSTKLEVESSEGISKRCMQAGVLA